MDLFDTRSVTFAEPIDMLYACHGKVKRFCSQIDMLPAYIGEHGFNRVAEEAVERIKHYFTVAAPLHHQDEEEDFFPLLVQYAPQAAVTVEKLEGQHERLHENWMALDAHFNRLQSGVEKQPDKALMRCFTEGYAAHIELEEALFEMGKTCIPPEKLSVAGRKMAARRRLA